MGGGITLSTAVRMIRDTGPARRVETSNLSGRAAGWGDVCAVTPTAWRMRNSLLRDTCYAATLPRVKTGNA